MGCGGEHERSSSAGWVRVGALGTATLAVLACLAGLAAAAPAASSGVVTLGIRGDYLTRTAMFCGQRDGKRYAYFRRQAPIAVFGSVRPKPSAPHWSVTVKFKRCVGNAFRTASEVRVAGRANGSFQGTSRPRLAGVYWARAYYNGSVVHGRSAKRWVVVR